MPDSQTEPDVQVTDISVVSQAAFAALISQAPRPTTQIDQPNQPDGNAPAPETPKPLDQPRETVLSEPDKPQDPGTLPDIASLAVPERAEVLTDAPLMDLPSTDEVGATLIVPTARLAPNDQNGLQQPDRLTILAPAQPAAPKVDTTPAPKPATDAEKAPVTEKATVDDPNAETPAKAVEERAPDQASTEIVTEAKAQEKTNAPVKTSRPKGRPVDLGARATAAAEIEKALAEAQAAATNGGQAGPTQPPAPTPVGPPLTGAEKDTLRLAVQGCWNVNPSSEAARITVTISVQMEINGKPTTSSIRLISASDGAESAKQSAFDAARRAIIRCAKTGYALPVEKYDRWRDIEMTFNPEKMRIK